MRKEAAGDTGMKQTGGINLKTKAWLFQQRENGQSCQMTAER